jgi:hypothetical protein
MSMETALRSRLKAHAPLAALVGTKIDWDERPQSNQLPGVTLQTINEPTDQNYQTVDGLQRVDVQVDVWARTSIERKAIKDAVKAAIIPAGVFYGIRFTRGFAPSGDSTERPEGALVFRSRIDLTFHYATA